MEPATGRREGAITRNKERPRDDRLAPRVQDAQRAGRNDVFVQPDDVRFVIRGSSGREHVFEPDGQLVTSLNRSDGVHRAKMSRGERIPITGEQFNRFKGLIHE